MIEHPIVKRPAVARTGSRVPALLGGVTAVALGLGVFFGLDARRAARAEGTLPPQQDAVMLATPQPLPAMPAPAPVPAPQFTVNNNVPTPPPPPPAAPPVDTGAADAALRQRLAAPALIVDISDPRSAPVQLAMQGAMPTNPALAGAAAAGAGAGAAAGAMAAGAQAGAPAARGVDEDAFSRRIGGEGPERVRATRIGDLDVLVPQGATIEGVLETALDSDLPGYARALVSRDVLSFDGSNVLIPRGSRVIGQYKAATALGASRIFVIWSRIIRPDGVSIQIGSPGTDELGRAGVGGKVDRHFLQRFGGSILLTVLNGGIAAGTAALTSGNGVFIGTASQANTLASSALDGSDIPPTIRTPQGAAVRIFVARDLDFSTVGPAR